MTTEQDLLPHSQKTTGELWLDVNSRFTIDTRPVLLPGTRAINNSLRNLFSCPIGARGRIHQPTYGNFLYPLLQEPLDVQTAAKLRASLIQSIERWEPRIKLDYKNTFVKADFNRVGYIVRVVYVYATVNEPQQYDLFIRL
jgi:phage baseplate assembly protein W